MGCGGCGAKGESMAFSELIAVYLFLGGTAAGSFAVFFGFDCYLRCAVRRKNGCPSNVADGQARRAIDLAYHRIAATVYAVSFVALCAGVLCLLADLGRPEAFYLLFLHPTVSFVSVGTYALALFGACVAVSLADAVLDLPLPWRKAARAARAVGTAAAFAVMAYTGALLKSVIAVSLWRSPWLVALFVTSALSCGCAVVIACACLHAEHRGAALAARCLAAADALLILLEACCAVGLIASLNAAYSSRPADALLFGDQAPAFWLGFVGCGMLVPLAIELFLLITGKTVHRPSAFFLLAALVLVGGFCLRFVLVAAGIQPAL